MTLPPEHLNEAAPISFPDNLMPGHMCRLRGGRFLEITRRPVFLWIAAVAIVVIYLMSYFWTVQ